MVGTRLPKALSKNPKVFNDPSTGLMNVPGSVGNLPASGVDFTVGGTVKGANMRKGNGSKGFKAGKKEGMRLTKIGSKRASRILK